MTEPRASYSNDIDVQLRAIVKRLTERMQGDPNGRDGALAAVDVIGKALADFAAQADPVCRQEWHDACAASATYLVRFIRRNAPWLHEPLPPFSEVPASVSYPYMLGVYF